MRVAQRHAHRIAAPLLALALAAIVIGALLARQNLADAPPNARLDPTSDIERQP